MATLTIDAVVPEDAGVYNVVIRSPCGSVAIAPAIPTVTAAAAAR